jgi:uncharacterized protein (DUF486 family)
MRNDALLAAGIRIAGLSTQSIRILSKLLQGTSMPTVILLICSNVFMTIAWYGHLKYKHLPLLAVIGVSWLIALPEYCFQVPANRVGYGRFSAPQLKIIQEAISITVFVLFSMVYLRETPNWRSGMALALIFVAVALAMTGPSKLEKGSPERQSAQAPVDP